MLYKFMFEYPTGPMEIVEDSGSIVEIAFGFSALCDTIKETDLIKETNRQLKQYFSGQRRSFDIPLNPAGTEFRKKVWKALMEIPYGETETYGTIAAKIGSPKASRAVGGANHVNPIPIIIPCHRVIGSGGGLTGYGGGLWIKEMLLELEKRNK